MPTNRRHRRRQRRQTEIPTTHLKLFASGCDFSETFRIEPLSTLRHGMADPQHVADVWHSVADKFMALWIEHYPGRRPWAWWRFDAPEPRILLDDDGPTACGPPDYFGMPSSWDGYMPDNDLRFESEADYLDRLGLLWPGEAERIDPTADQRKGRCTSEFIDEVAAALAEHRPANLN